MLQVVAVEIAEKFANVICNKILEYGTQGSLKQSQNLFDIYFYWFTAIDIIDDKW